MPPISQFSWRAWPAVAVLLATLFIAYGIDLVSRSRALQQSIGQELRLLNDLNILSDTIQHLGAVHRSDLSDKQYRWSRELKRVQDHTSALWNTHAQAPALADLTTVLTMALQRMDSLHREAMEVEVATEEMKHSTAVFQIMMQHARKAVDNASRRVHEEGLGKQSEKLSGHWTEAQILLLAACLLAVLFAWLVGLSNRLLRTSLERATQLDSTRKDLEQRNRELRDTMLSKEEKEVMIKEIHHRVKNNLQIVKSLIRFQMDQVKDPVTLELFNECVNRVSAMALVHEQTYLSKDLANIDVGNYFNSLIRDLVHAYSVGIELRMDVDIRVNTLSVDALVPLGLLINEVISNSFKHAFKGRSTGTIIVHLDGNEADGLRMRIGDNGVGLSDRNSWKKPQSLGMELIHTLAGQLDVDVELADGPGTVYMLSPQQVQYRKRA